MKAEHWNPLFRHETSITEASGLYL